jgi:hypothetical protein
MPISPVELLPARRIPPFRRVLTHGVTYERDGVIPHYIGVEDRNGRLMIFLTRNCDLGDAWEWIDDPRYPIKYGMVAYKVAINVVIYAMTH